MGKTFAIAGTDQESRGRGSSRTGCCRGSETVPQDFLPQWTFFAVTTPCQWQRSGIGRWEQVSTQSPVSGPSKEHQKISFYLKSMEAWFSGTHLTKSLPANFSLRVHSPGSQPKPARGDVLTI